MSKPRNLTLVASLLAIVVGVLLAGSEAHPTNLLLVWMLPVAVAQAWTRRRASWGGFACLVVVFSAAVVGLVDTMGGERLASVGGFLVCLGLTASILASLDVGPWGRPAEDAP